MNKIKEKLKKKKQLLTLLWKFLIFIYLQWTLHFTLHYKGMSYGFIICSLSACIHFRIYTDGVCNAFHTRQLAYIGSFL